MKNYIIYFILLFATKSAAQNTQIYLDDNLNKISKKEFEKPLRKNEYATNFKLDTAEVNIRVNRFSSGKLSVEEFKLIKDLLSEQSQITISEKDVVIINYYPGKDECNSTGNLELVKKKYQDYISKIAEKKNIKQFFIYKDPKGTENYGDLKWMLDPKGLIESKFFNIHYPCGSNVVIKNDGTYNSNRGEYDISKILVNLGK